MAAADEAPYIFPKKFLALIPALYAWQVYGWRTGFAIYVLTLVLLVALSWTFVVANWPLKWLIRARFALIMLSMVAIGLSAMESCNFELSECHQVFGGKSH